MIIILEIVSSTAIIAIGDKGMNYREIPPLTYRSALTQLTTLNGQKVMSRLIGINSYYFHIFLPIYNLSDANINTIRDEAFETLSGSVYLNDKDRVILTMGDRDGLSTQLPRMIAEFNQYRDFFNRERNKKGN